MAIDHGVVMVAIILGCWGAILSIFDPNNRR